MGTARELVIGIDFDNTLVVYDELFWNMAVRRGLIPPAVPRAKREIRDAIRLLPEGEVHWQRLQAAAYGPQIAEAQPADGAADFLGQCRAAGARLYVVSHKTELAGYDETNTNLREAALGWLWAKGFFAHGSLVPGDVYFAATRAEKIARLAGLGCTHFIDDLEETFAETTFPADVARILYAPHPPAIAPPGVMVAESWKQLCEYFFADNG
jgi:hypothetical protein